MSAVLGLRPPTVILVPEGAPVGIASTYRPRAIVVRANHVPAPGADIPRWLLAALAHELGHHLPHREHWFAGVASRSAALAGVFGALNGPGRRRVTVVAAAGMVAVPALSGLRWAERAADEVSRLLGHGGSLAWYLDWCASEAIGQRGLRSVSARCPQFLRSHPPLGERARLIRDDAERARVARQTLATRLAWPPV
jgi:hypothetical protein